jgi:hypothetical protein
MIHLGVYKHKESLKEYIYLCEAFEAPYIIQLYDIIDETGLDVYKVEFTQFYAFTGTFFDSQTGKIVKENII